MDDRIAFVVDAGDRPAHAGAIRPFLTWARSMRERGMDAPVIILDPNPSVEGFCTKNGIPFRSFQNHLDAAAFVRKGGYQTLVIDDAPRMLEMGSAIADKSGANLAIYAIILLGLHSIGHGFDLSRAPLKERVFNKAIKAVPFTVFRKMYRRLTGGRNCRVISCSRTASTLLHAFYGIEPAGMVYPPVDAGVFRNSGNGRKRQALVYLGSYGFDTDERFAEEVCSRLKSAGYLVKAFGNEQIGRRLAKKRLIDYAQFEDDRALAAAYSESTATVCLQKWELFGYVAAESIMCKTPVIAFDCLGYSEIIAQTGGGVSVQNREQFLETVADLDAALASVELCVEKAAAFDSESSADALGRVLSGGRRGVRQA